MKIYFGAAVSYSRKFLPKYQLIVRLLKKMGHQILSEHVADPKLKIGDGLTPEELFERETKTIDKADLMVAEVTVPSWGTPFLASHALAKNKPVLALFYGQTAQEIPMMIKGHPELYVESYDEDNIKVVLKKFLSHVKKQKRRKGKFIVIDGSNGSGKATQTRLLIDYLKQKNIKTKSISFPRYYSSFHGRIVGRFLAGEFGNLNEVSPYLSSLAFALDRVGVKDEIEEWLLKGTTIISDRYVTSSMAHQAAKMPKSKQKEFVDWVDELEYRVHKMPREDLVIFLYVPWKISLELTKNKEKRAYLKGKKLDIEESDLEYLKKTEGMYFHLAKTRKNWVKIDCVKKGEMRSVEDIHREILAILKKKKII